MSMAPEPFWKLARSFGRWQIQDRTKKGKDEEERDTIQHAKDRIDECVAKQREEPIYHKQEGGK